MLKEENAGKQNHDDSRRRFLGTCLTGAVSLTALALSGCSGGFNNNLINGDTGTFFSADQSVGNGQGRSFVELKNGVPLRLGVEFTPQALTGLPDSAPNAIAPAFLGPLPAKTHGTPFTNVLVGYVSSHPETNEPEHFHVVLLIRPLLVTSPPFDNELAAVAPAEVAPGHVRQATGALVPGGGVIYDDPNVPTGAAPDTTIGENYIYLDGHMNGFIFGHTLDFMRTKQLFALAIPQPQVYPRDGFYPTKWKVRFDAARSMHIIEVTDFVRAVNIVPPGA